MEDTRFVCVSYAGVGGAAEHEIVTVTAVLGMNTRGSLVLTLHTQRRPPLLSPSSVPRVCHPASVGTLSGIVRGQHSTPFPLFIMFTGNVFLFLTALLPARAAVPLLPAAPRGAPVSCAARFANSSASHGGRALQSSITPDFGCTTSTPCSSYLGFCYTYSCRNSGTCSSGGCLCTSDADCSRSYKSTILQPKCSNCGTCNTVGYFFGCDGGG